MENNKKDSALVRSSAAEYLTFVASTGEDKDSIEMRYEDENIWLTQKMMATLYDVGLPTINEHINHVFKEGELEKEEVVRKFRITTQHGVMAGKTQEHDVMFYNLDAILSDIKKLDEDADAELEEIKLED